MFLLDHRKLIQNFKNERGEEFKKFAITFIKNILQKTNYLLHWIFKTLKFLSDLKKLPQNFKSKGEK